MSSFDRRPDISSWRSCRWGVGGEEEEEVVVVVVVMAAAAVTMCIDTDGSHLSARTCYARFFTEQYIIRKHLFLRHYMHVMQEQLDDITRHKTCVAVDSSGSGP